MTQMPGKFYPTSREEKDLQNPHPGDTEATADGSEASSEASPKKTPLTEGQH